jgi:hypothetical protein
MRFFSRSMNQFPIPAANATDKAKLTKLAECAATAATAADTAAVTLIERNIDEIVYRLFDLTPTEITQIETALANTRGSASTDDADDDEPKKPKEQLRDADGLLRCKVCDWHKPEDEMISGDIVELHHLDPISEAPDEVKGADCRLITGSPISRLRDAACVDFPARNSPPPCQSAAWICFPHRSPPPGRRCP